MQIQTSTSARASEDNAILLHISNFQHSYSVRREDRLLSPVVWIHTSPFVNLPRYLIFNPLFVYFSDNSRYEQQCAGCLLQLLCCGHGDTIVTPTVVSLILPRHMSRINITASLALWHKVSHFCYGVTKWAARHATLLHLRKSERERTKSEKKFSSVKKWAPSKNCLVFAARGEEGK